MVKFVLVIIGFSELPKFISSLCEGPGILT